MEVIPHLIQLSTAIIRASLTSSSLIVPRATASNIRQRAITLRQRRLQIAQRHGRTVARLNASGAEPAVRGQALVVLDRGLEELGDLLVLDVLGPVAGDVEGRVARAVLAEFVRPEVGVGRALVDPVLVHVGEQAVLAEGADDSVDGWALVWRDDGAVWQTICGVWRWDGVELAVQVAVLCVRSVTEVWPKTV